jgi:hypothetical protein
MLLGGCGCRRVHVMLAVQRRSNLDPFLDTLQAMVGCAKCMAISGFLVRSTGCLLPCPVKIVGCTLS